MFTDFPPKTVHCIPAAPDNRLQVTMPDLKQTEVIYFLLIVGESDVAVMIQRSTLEVLSGAGGKEHWEYGLSWK